MAVGDPGVRTAPAASGAATGRLVTLHLIDSSGDLWAESLTVPVGATGAAIEAWADNYADASQASLWMITSTSEWRGAKQASNANTDQRNSVKDGINQLWYNITNRISDTTRIVAPILDAMDGDKDIPNTGAGSPLILLNISQAALTDGFSEQTAQYTERRERKNNPRV